MSKKVAVFLLFGQSNAVGHSLAMPENDCILTPLNNVLGLKREENQSFDNDALVFSGYTSHSMNLGETQDNTYSLANCLAKLWQAEIDAGNPRSLPDLYIVHVAIGAQGVYGMWHPDREKKLIPGKLGEADISLFPFTCHVLSLLEKYFREHALTPDYIGLHWRGGEQDTLLHLSLLQSNLKTLYVKIFSGMRQAIGCDAPLVLHKMPFYDAMKKQSIAKPDVNRTESMEYINRVFDELSLEYPPAHVFDVTNAPHCDFSIKGYGLTKDDYIHFTKETNEWVAKEIFQAYKKA